MSDDRLTFARFFAEKDVIQFLITIVIFSLILIFSPNNLHELIVTKSGIPYAMYIFSFAVAYLIGQFFMSVVPLYHRGTQMKRKLKTLNSLSTEQLFLLESFFKTHSPTFWAAWDNPDAETLVKAGIVRPVGSCIDGVSVMFKIEPEYESLMLSTWNPCTKRFDISR